MEDGGDRRSTRTSECVQIPRRREQREPRLCESHHTKVCIYRKHSSNPTHAHRLLSSAYTWKIHGDTCKQEGKLADCLLHDSGCLYSPSHLFSSHRQHAAALLHSDWLVLGPRAERSGTQAAEQVESQDRRGQRSLQGQTGVRPGHNRPPSELTQPANRLAPALSTPQCSGDGNWASNLPLNAKGAFMWPSEAPGAVADG